MIINQTHFGSGDNIVGTKVVGPKKKLLITGAFGLVGSNICKRLERDYPDIEITKVKFDGIIESIDAKIGDILEPFDYIIHAAGYGQPIRFSEDRLKTIDINTRTTKFLFNFLKRDGGFLFVSTSEIYSGAKSPYKETDIGTTSPQHPRACYIEGKRCGEAICMAYEEEGYDVKIARLALAYGPGTKKGDTRVINQFIESALVNKSIIMKDSGSAIRTYCYVDDVVTQLLNILFHGKQTVYNVGGFSRVTIKDLAHSIARMTDAAVMEGDKSLDGAPDDVALDMTRYISEFGGTFTQFGDGLLKTIEYQKELYGIK